MVSQGRDVAKKPNEWQVQLAALQEAAQRSIEITKHHIADSKKIIDQYWRDRRKGD